MVGEDSNRQVADGLRNELTVIIGQCEMLEDALSNQTPLLAHIRVIKTAALRMAERISNQPWPDMNVTPKTKNH